MKREQLEHVLRACAAIADEKSFVVVGSQAVLMSHPDAPAELLLSNEIDLYPALHPERSDLIDGAIGQLSLFHDTYGYYADGVGPETAIMPADWVRSLLRHGLIELPRLLNRLSALGFASDRTGTLHEWARRRAAEAATHP
jgi:hypothetical protein